MANVFQSNGADGFGILSGEQSNQNDGVGGGSANVYVKKQVIYTDGGIAQDIAPAAPGVAGPRGPIGDKGPVGDKGATGDKGLTGDKGVTGDQGPVGPQGPVGDKGATGDRGPAGGADSTVPGPAGPAGSQGPVGPQGEKGINILAAISSFSSLPVPGPGMLPGDAYYVNDTKSIWIYTQPGQWVEWRPFPDVTVGPQGPAGAPGAGVNSTPPASSIGSPGNVPGLFAVDANYFYFCTGTFDNFTPIWTRTPLNATW
jgi:hypothetical protein